MTRLQVLNEAHARGDHEAQRDFSFAEWVECAWVQGHTDLAARGEAIIAEMVQAGAEFLAGDPHGDAIHRGLGLSD